MKNLVIRAWPIFPIIILLILPNASLNFQSVNAIAILGAIYQILGLGIVFVSISEKLKHFTGVSLFKGLLNWFIELLTWFKSLWPWRKSKIVNIRGSVTGSGSVMGNGTITQQINHLAVEKQLEWLHNKINEISKKIAENDESVKKEISNLNKKMTGIEASISLKIAEFNEKLGAFMTGGFKWEFVGTFALALGVVFGTIPWWVSEFYS